MRLQNADDIAQIEHGSLEPGGQPVVTLKPREQNATITDIAELVERLRRIESQLSTTR